MITNSSELSVRFWWPLALQSTTLSPTVVLVVMYSRPVSHRVRLIVHGVCSRSYSLTWLILGKASWHLLRYFRRFTAVCGLRAIAGRVVKFQLHSPQYPDGFGYARLEFFTCGSKIQFPNVVLSGPQVYTSTLIRTQACDERVSGIPGDVDGEMVAANTAGVVLGKQYIAGLRIASEDEALGKIFWTWVEAQGKMGIRETVKFDILCAYIKVSVLRVITVVSRSISGRSKATILRIFRILKYGLCDSTIRLH